MRTSLLGLGWIQLQPVCLHPRRNLVNADRHLLYKTASVRRLTVTVNLSVVCIRTRREMMTLTSCYGIVFRRNVDVEESGCDWNFEMWM